MRGIRTARGGDWHHSTVRNLLVREGCSGGTHKRNTNDDIFVRTQYHFASDIGKMELRLEMSLSSANRSRTIKNRGGAEAARQRLGSLAQISLIGLMIVSISACTQYWAKPGGTSAEFDATKTACNGRSYAQFPPAFRQVMIMGAYTTPMQTTCTGFGYTTNCYTTGGQYVPATYMTVDDNESARSSSAVSCLYSAGWRPAKDKEDAQRITNGL